MGRQVGDQRPQPRRAGEHLRAKVEQAALDVALLQVELHGLALLGAHIFGRRGEHGAVRSRSVEVVHLVASERNQGAHNESKPFAQQDGHLKAHRLPERRRRRQERRAPVPCGSDEIALERLQLVDAELPRHAAHVVVVYVLLLRRRRRSRRMVARAARRRRRPRDFTSRALQPRQARRVTHPWPCRRPSPAARRPVRWRPLRRARRVHEAGRGDNYQTNLPPFMPSNCPSRLYLASALRQP